MNKISWYKKINWIKLITTILTIFTLFTLFFNYLGKNRDLEQALRTSFIISLLIGTDMVLKDLYSNKNIIIMKDKNKLEYIDLQDGKDGKLISNLEYNDIIEKSNPKDIYDNIGKYQGLIRGEIKEIISVKKKNNCIKVKALVEEKRWKSIGKVVIKKLLLEEKKYYKTIIIKNDIEKYEEVYELFVKN
jgi:hypothetical protein